MSADSRVTTLAFVAIASLVAACSGNEGSISGPRVVSVAGVKVDGKTVALGSQVDGSGGVLDRSDPLLPDLPKECAGLEVFALQEVESSKH